MKILYASMLLAFSASSAMAAEEFIWTGNVSNQATDSNNWSVTDNAALDNTTFTINSNGNNAAFYSTDDNDGDFPVGSGGNLLVGSGAGSDGKFTVHMVDGGSGAGWEKVGVGVDGGQGELILDFDNMKSSGQFHMTDLNVGTGAGSQGILTINSNGADYYMYPTVVANNYEAPVKIGAEGGQGTININGGRFGDHGSTQNSILIGSGTGSVGQVNVLGGGKFSAGMMSTSEPDAAVSIGEQGGTGTMTISGTSADGKISFADFGTRLNIGDAGTGSVFIGNQGQLRTYSTYHDPDSLPEGDRWNEVGLNGGKGQVTIDGAGSGWYVMGYVPGGLLMGSEATEAGSLYVGSTGEGEVAISNGGRLAIGSGEAKYNEDYTSRDFDAESFVASGTLHLGTETGGKGTLSIGGTLGTAAQGVGILDVAGIQFGDGEGTVHFNHTDTSGTYEFDTILISGAGQSNILHRNGVTLFNVDQTQFTGQTSVEGGHLIVNGKLGGNVTVNGQGTLGGTGQVGDVVVGNGGTITPGAYNEDRTNPASSAVLTADSVTFGAGSTLSIQGNPTGEIDLLKTTQANGGSGTVTLDSGSELYIQAGADTWAEHTKYTFINAEGGLTGQFSMVDSNLAFLTSHVQYDANEAYLYLTRNNTGFDSVGNTYNERSTGAGIETLGPGHAVYDTIVSMSAKQANSAFNNLSGEIHANVKGALLTGSRHTRQAVNDHLNPGLQMGQINPHRNLWIDAWGHTGSIDNDGNSSQLDTRGAGFLVGWDAYQNDNTTLGVAAGYEYNKVDADKLRDSKAETDMLHLMAYGATSVGEVDLKGGIGYAWLGTDTERNITVPGLEAKHKANYNGNMVQAFVEGSHTFEVSEQLSVTPYAGVAYQRVHTNSATEKGDTATALHYRGGSDDLMSGTVGVRGTWQVSDKAQVYGNLGWQSNFGGDEPKANLNFAGSNVYNVKGSSLNSNSAVVGVGAQFKTGQHGVVRIGYDAEIGNRAKNHAARVLWELKF